MSAVVEDISLIIDTCHFVVRRDPEITRIITAPPDSIDILGAFGKIVIYIVGPEIEDSVRHLIFCYDSREKRFNGICMFFRDEALLDDMSGNLYPE